MTLTTPDNSVVRPTFNEANLLERVEVNLRGEATVTTFVNDIDYNAKGQRKLIEYGNGVTTTYEYDPLTFRLTNLQTLRNSTKLQDLRHTYDPAGNVTAIRDDAQQTTYFNNSVVEPHADYTYDAVYRLLAATGREHLGQVSQPQTTRNDESRVNLFHPHDGQAMRRYTEQFEYDDVSNILELIHQATNGDWTRVYAYNEPSLIEPGKNNNRLSSTAVGLTNEAYTHDPHGNMISFPHLPQMVWDFEDQLQMVDLGGGGKAYYVYDAAGQRTRKVWEKSPGLTEERIYLGSFEIFRRRNGTGTVMLERETLHIMDSLPRTEGGNSQRIALVETRTLDMAGNDPTPQQLIRYQFGNHLGSASLELDDQAQIITYEEYTPYGSTSYQAVRSETETPKRYRYTGKERDEESGFYYHGARYYASWLGRWTAVDPAVLVDGVNAYRYVLNNPVKFWDPNGSEPATGHWEVTNNLKKFKPRLERWRRELTEEIRTRNSETSRSENDFRFLLPLAQRLVEQGGLAERTTGNNPYNIVGKGNVTEKPTVQAPNGLPIRNNTDEQIGIRDYFKQIQRLTKAWRPAYETIVQGGSIEAFGAGLQPTYSVGESQEEYTNKIRFRYKNLIIDFQRVLQDDINTNLSKIMALEEKLKWAEADRSLANKIVALKKENEQLRGEIEELDRILQRVERNEKIEKARNLNPRAHPNPQFESLNPKFDQSLKPESTPIEFKDYRP